MKFSIITPSYNQGRFLADCIESVMNQGVDFEHIVIDAGSTDETLDVLAKHPHLNWVSEPDRGMSDGINKGFQKATGDWLMWLNCDDYLLPGALEKVAAFIKDRPNASVVHGDCLFVREDKSVIRRKLDHDVDENTLLFVGCFIPSTSTFFKRSIIDDGHLLDISYKVCMDWEYYMRLLRLGFQFAYIPQALAGFRWHGNNTSILHLQKGNDEARKLQREHMTKRKMHPLLGSKWVLSFMRRFYQAKRVAQRLGTHGRIR